MFTCHECKMEVEHLDYELYFLDDNLDYGLMFCSEHCFKVWKYKYVKMNMPIETRDAVAMLLFKLQEVTEKLDTLKSQESELRNQLKEFVLPYGTIRDFGIMLYLKDDYDRRKMEYNKLESHYPEQYEWLIAHKMLVITPADENKKTLVITKEKGGTQND